MIIVRLMGGLGNQMFQYAAGLHLATIHRTRLKLDHSFLEDRTPRPNFTRRDYHLHRVGVPDARATPAEVARYRTPRSGMASAWQRWQAGLFPCHLHVESSPPVFTPGFAALPRRTFLEGYFQDERYFAPLAAVLRKRFRDGLASLDHPPEAIALAAEIQAAEAVCFHIRRGDYVNLAPTSAFHGVMSPAYYANGLQKLRTLGINGPVYVFSDDPEWCRENLRTEETLHFVPESIGGESGTTHLHLMSLCRHFVIANSSFSWWAAWLADTGPHRVVFRPSSWYRHPSYRDIHPCPASWHPLEDPCAC